ncbi:hypothetical protein C8R43DRAFT_1129273 [Mycena crocata]|nr:hypothetical protein C8R43DRAFT_1129273 [Mycena crocata]
MSHSPSFSQLIATEIHSRLLARLHDLPVFLLSHSSVGRDFYLFVHDAWRQYRFLLSNGDSFEPIILGQVFSVQYSEDGSADIELTLPAYSGNAMDVFYWNQVACLSSAVAAQARSTPSNICLEDTLPWHSFASRSTCEAGLINIYVPSTVAVSLNTPTRALAFAVETLSPSPTASTSTLISTSDALDAPPVIRPRDLLVAKVALSSRDIPRPNPPDCSCSRPHFIRLYTIRTRHVEIIV